MTRPYNWQLMLRLARTMAFNRAEPKKENAPHKAGHYLNLVARGGIEPPTQGFSTLIDRPRFFCNQRHTA